jgi:hypothetical protein
MYIRVERVDELVEALKAVQANAEFSANYTRSISSRLLPDFQTTLNLCVTRVDEHKSLIERIEQRITACTEEHRLALERLEQRIAASEECVSRLTALMHDHARYVNAFATAGSFEIQQRVLGLLKLLRPHRAKGFAKARFGSPNDGGYILIDDFDQIDAAFSFGIEQNASWDVCVADRGVPVYQFDHTIDTAPVTRDDLIFFKKRIVAQPAPGCETINDLVAQHGRTGSASLILKIDIEHDEWPVFDATSVTALSCFSQIVCEFHGFGFMIDPQWNERARRVLEKITGQFGVVHVHANNHCGLNSVANTPVPEVLEITFANRSRYRLAPTDEIFPGPLDAPNHPYLPDIRLGPFVY